MPKQSVAVQFFYDGAWHNVSDRVLAPSADGGQPIVITSGQPAEGMPDSPCRVTFSVRNTDGLANPRNPASPWYGKVVVAKPGRPGTPIMVIVGSSVRCVVELVAATPEHSEDGRHAWVRIEGAGLLQRFANDTREPQSALYRYVVRHDPVAYWTLASTNLADVDLPVVGRHRFNIGAGVARFGSAPLAPWLPPGASIADGVRMGGNVTMNRTPGQWAVDWLANVTADSRAFAVYISGNGPGTDADERIDWRISLRPADGEIALSMIFATGDTSSEIGLDLPIAAPQVFNGRAHHFRWQVVQNGANIDWQLFVDGGLLRSGSQNGFSLQGVGRVTVLSPAGAGSSPAAFGHVIVWEDIPSLFDTVAAAFGHIGETPLQRMMRVCDEEGVTFLVSSLEDGPPMGPQPTARPIEVWREAAATGRGILADARTAIALQYRPLRSQYNQDPAVTLDYAAEHVAPPLLPVYDDQAATVADLTSTVNAMHPDLAGDVAGWGAHIAAHDGARFPLIRVDLVANPDLVTAVNGLEVGDRVAVVNLPPFISVDPVSVIVTGITETIGTHTRTIDLTCVPEETHRVLIYRDPADPTPGPNEPVRFDTDGSETVGTFSAGTDTSLDVLTTRGPLWTANPADLPLQVRVAGVTLNVTAVADSVTDTFTRTVSNGWGTADTGQTWAVIEGAASGASVGSGVGTLDSAIMGLGSFKDVEVLAKITPGDDADGSLLARITDQGAGNWAYYEVALEPFANHVGLWIRDDVAEIYAEVAFFEIPITAGASYWCRMRVRGHQISLKVWPDGSTEPTSWVSYEDTAETVDEGAVGLAAFFGEVEFDDFAVVNPQRFTVDQTPVNGVEKSVPAGSPLRLATPAAFGL